MTIVCELKTVDTFKDFVEKLLNIAWISDLTQNFNDFLIRQKVEAGEVFSLRFEVYWEAFNYLLKLKISIDQRIVYSLSSTILVDISLRPNESYLLFIKCIQTVELNSLGDHLLS